LIINELAQEPIVEPMQLLAKVRRRLEQEAPQTLGIGITGQAGEVLESAIGLQQGGGFQTIQSQDHGIDQGQQHLRQLVALVATRIVQMAGEAATQLQHSGEFVEKQHPAIMGQTRVIKGDSDVLGRSAHSDLNLTKSDVKVRP
jgi:hypothetical protein